MVGMGVASLGLLFAPALASAASFTEGSVSVIQARPLSTSGVVSSALGTSAGFTSTSFSDSLDLFYDTSWLHIEMGSDGDPVGDLRYVMSSDAGSMSFSFDLESYLAWSQNGGNVRFNGVVPTESNPIPEPGALLLFGVGFAAFAFQQRVRAS